MDEFYKQIARLLSTFRPPGYHKMSQESHDESLLNEPKLADAECDDETRFPDATTNTRPQRPWLIWVLYAILFILYSFLLVTYVPRKYSDIECSKQVSLWSPMNEAIEYIEFDFDNEFDKASKYRGPPTPELETAWENLWRFEPVPFPEAKLPLVNRSNGVLNGAKLARLGDGNKGEVAANFEIYHQLHCLNYLRQYSWRDWYFRHPDKVATPLDMLASDVGARMHADHCIDLLRTSLMCHGDTTPFFTVIDDSQPLGARGDFSAHHKCRNFEKLQSWTRENGKQWAPFDEDAE